MVWTSFNDCALRPWRRNQEISNETLHLQSPLYPETKPKNNLSQLGKFELERHASIDAIFHEFTEHVEEGREEGRTKDLVCILNVDFNYKHRVRDIIFAGKDAGKGKKLAIAYCRAPTTIPHPEYLKRNPLWIVKQTKTIPSNYFSYSYIFRCLLSSHSTATRFLPPSLFQRDDEISCWILIRSYQRAGDRLENVFPRLWTKGGSEQGRGGRGGLYPRVRDVCFVFSCAWIGAERESLLEERSLSQFLSRGCRVNGIESFELEVWSASSFTRSDSLVKNWREWFMRWGRFLSNFSIEVVSPLFFFFYSKSSVSKKLLCLEEKGEGNS